MTRMLWRAAEQVPASMAAVYNVGRTEQLSAEEARGLCRLGGKPRPRAGIVEL